MPPGKLDVTVLNARNLKNTETFSRQDPFFVVQVGSTHFTSGVAIDAGRNPVWNARFSFDIQYEDKISFTIRNRNVVTTDALIGSAHVSLAKVFADGKHDVVAQVVTSSNRVQGELSVILLFYPHGGKTGGQSSKPGKAQHMQPHPGMYAPPQVGVGQQGAYYQGSPPPMQFGSYTPPTAPSAPPMPNAPVPAQQPPPGYPQAQQPPMAGHPTSHQSPPPGYPQSQSTTHVYPNPQSLQPPAGYPPYQQPQAGYPPPQQHHGMYTQPGGYSPAQGGMLPAGYPQQPTYSPGYMQPGAYGYAPAAPAGMYYGGHHGGKHNKYGKKGKNSKKGMFGKRKKWF